MEEPIKFAGAKPMSRSVRQVVYRDISQLNLQMMVKGVIFSASQLK